MPTIKQKKAFQKITENHGNLYKAMIEVGYDEDTAKRPKNLTESKGWQELVKEYLPDDKILRTHERSLEATKLFSSHTEPDKEIPDHAIRLKAVELAYKVKGQLSENNINLNQTKILVMPQELGQKYDINSPITEETVQK